MAIETWYGQAVLIGGGAIVAQEYPLRGGIARDNAEVARFAMAAPTRVAGTFGYPVLRQEVDLEVVANEASAQSTAIEVLRMLADAVGFASMQRVEVKLPSIANATPTAVPPATKTIPIMSPIRMPTDLVEVRADWLGFLWDQIADPTGERGCRIVRSMRWLRRSIGALDEVEEFTVLAFGLEAIADLLPDPETAWLKALRTDQRRSMTFAADHSEKLRYFATLILGLPENDWKDVGGKRHSLFHGGLTEDADTLNTLRIAIPPLRRVLIAAIKHVLAISGDFPPPGGVPVPFGDVSLTFSAPLQFLEPSSDLSERPSMFPERRETDGQSR